MRKLVSAVSLEHPHAAHSINLACQYRNRAASRIQSVSTSNSKQAMKQTKAAHPNLLLQVSQQYVCRDVLCIAILL